MLPPVNTGLLLWGPEGLATMSPFNSRSPDAIMRDHFAVEEASGLRPQAQTLKPFGASSAGMGVASVRHHHADIPESASVQGLGLPSREDLLLGLISCMLNRLLRKRSRGWEHYDHHSPEAGEMWVRAKPAQTLVARTVRYRRQPSKDIWH